MQWGESEWKREAAVSFINKASLKAASSNRPHAICNMQHTVYSIQDTVCSTQQAACGMQLWKANCQMQPKLILAKVNLWHNSLKLPAPGIGIMNEQSNEQSAAATPAHTHTHTHTSLKYAFKFAYAFAIALIHSPCWQNHLALPLNEWVHHRLTAGKNCF